MGPERAEELPVPGSERGRDCDMSIQPNQGLRLNEAKLPDGMLRYHVFGRGRISIVIEMGLAASAGE